ncbi:hypothetical protein F383_06321 [Gossypium arboreum]|uniref:Uncharacterized protein n=1 Tax=Gossypium arboreum TaxID=29729 RepID=A0A0B0P6F2_GOSAR|nr:hypothetical protein F383_06321 [Gossypium arboreum]
MPLSQTWSYTKSDTISIFQTWSYTQNRSRCQRHRCGLTHRTDIRNHMS